MSGQPSRLCPEPIRKRRGSAPKEPVRTAGADIPGSVAFPAEQPSGLPTCLNYAHVKSVRKLQLPFDRVEAGLLAQGIHEWIDLQDYQI